MIKQISCRGYRGFSKEGVLELAQPNGKRGGGLTVLVGPNGGGKSTLMECFQKLATKDISFTEGKRNKLAEDKVVIKISFVDDKVAVLSTDGGSETKWASECGDTVERPKVYYLPSRRFFNPYFRKTEYNRKQFIANPENSQYRGSQSNHFTYRLFDVNKQSEEFNKLFWEILGKELHWTIDQDDAGNYYVKVKKENTVYHNSDGLGEGIVSLLFMVDAILKPESDELIVIDEPELSLHPQLQLRLLDKLLEVTKNFQVVIATHSPNMVSIEAAINGGQIARVFEKDSTSVISCIDEKCRGYFSSYIENIYNPHMWGTDARSCFFAEEGLIITEGQEDVLLFPKILEQLGSSKNVPFFGFGAGGASNIEQIAHILKCLGFSRIGALFDGDKESEYEKFKKNFPDYQAWILPAGDIRDKDAINKAEKFGLLDSTCKIKAEYNTEDLKQMFNEIVQFSE